MTPKIYHAGEREIHMTGSYVGVCWNTTKEQRQIKGEDGLTYYALAPVRDGAPYIDFVLIRERNGEVWEDEDSPVDGGISINEAERIINELGWAVEYIRTATYEQR